VDGDFIMTAEVQPVLKALRKRGIHVVALHDHMIGEERSFYLRHSWGKGSTRELVEGIKEARNARKAAASGKSHSGKRPSQEAFRRGTEPALDLPGIRSGRSARLARKELVMRWLSLAAGLAVSCLTVGFVPSPAEAQSAHPRPVDSSSSYQSTRPYPGMPGSYNLTTPATAPSGINLSVPYAMPPYVRVVDVGLYDNSFIPGIVYIRVGTVVRWTNRGDHHHTVTSDEGFWDSGELRPGEGYAVYFPLPGTYYYHCRLHARDMGAWVVVRGGY